MPRITADELERWRYLDAARVLRCLADYAKEDVSFRPLKAKSSTRWHVSVNGHEFELLLTGPKFFDTRDAKGGGGAVDLAMHLLGADFTAAAARLRKCQL